LYSPKLLATVDTPRVAVEMDATAAVVVASP
jgi:hypothetical protein